MSRSERYIQPSAEELERWRRAAEAAKRCDVEREQLLRAALKKMRKADLVELTLRVAHEGESGAWLLEREVGLDKPVHLLVNDTAVAIDIATQVAKEQMNYNFDYEGRAYDAVRRGLSQMIEKGAIEEVKSLALNLIAKGSYQMNCTDEGLMQEDIENCLRQVIPTVARSPGGSEWAREMLRHDGTGCICHQELAALAGAAYEVSGTLLV